MNVQMIKNYPIVKNLSTISKRYIMLPFHSLLRKAMGHASEEDLCLHTFLPHHQTDIFELSVKFQCFLWIWKVSSMITTPFVN